MSEERCVRCSGPRQSARHENPQAVGYHRFIRQWDTPAPSVSTPETPTPHDCIWCALLARHTTPEYVAADHAAGHPRTLPAVPPAEEGTLREAVEPDALRRIAKSLERVDWSGGSCGQQIIEDAADYIAALRARVADLECRPLVLLTQRETLADTLVEAQVCDRAEAERRALARYPGGAR